MRAVDDVALFNYPDKSTCCHFFKSGVEIVGILLDKKVGYALLQCSSYGEFDGEIRSYN